MLKQSLSASRIVVLRSVGGELPEEVQPSLTKGRIAALRAHLTSCAKTALKQWEGIKVYSETERSFAPYSGDNLILNKKQSSLAVHAVLLKAKVIDSAERPGDQTAQSAEELYKTVSGELFALLSKGLGPEQFERLKSNWDARITAMAEEAKTLFLEGGNKRGSRRTAQPGKINPTEPKIEVFAKDQTQTQSLLAPALRPLRLELASSIYETLVDTLISSENASNRLAPRGTKISPTSSHPGAEISPDLRDKLARYKQMIDQEFCMDLWKLDTALDALAKSSASRHNAPDMPPALQQAIDKFFPALELVIPGNSTSAIGKFDPFYRLAVDLERSTSDQGTEHSILITDLSEFKVALNYFEARAKVKE